VLHCLEQLGIIGGIALAVGIPGRVDAGCTTQGVHCQPRIIGQRRQARGTRRVAGLENGILDKTQTSFLGFFAYEVTLRQYLDMAAEHGLQLLELAGIVAGQHQARERYCAVTHRDGTPAGSAGYAPARPRPPAPAPRTAATHAGRPCSWRRSRWRRAPGCGRASW